MIWAWQSIHGRGARGVEFVIFSHMLLAGLDLSLTSTGLSIGGQTRIVSTQKKGAERLSIISREVVSVLEAEQVDCAIIEGYSFASRNSQAHSIGELGGCVRMRLWEIGLPFVDVPPTCRAKFATGKGNAGKAEVISSISAKIGRVFSGNGGADECDAWVLEEMGLAHLNISSWAWTKEQMSSLTKVDWLALDSVVNNKKAENENNPN